MKICSKCKENKKLDEFYSDKRRKYGLSSYCKICHRVSPEKNRAKSAVWRKANPGKVNARVAKRKANKLKATPKWLSKDQLEEIKRIYDSCPVGYHVDHIVPLQGKNVKGLHVPWNLQHLTAEENYRKNNKFN